MAAALLSMTVLVTTSAGAAENDDFAAVTTDGCGVAQFKDYGPGAPGGGNNDDYLVIHDYCEVCLVDGPADPTPSRCGEASHRSADG